MKICKTDEKRHYKRVIQKHGDQLVCFNIEVACKGSEPVFLYTFGNNRKPPLEVAIDAYTSFLEYVCFWVCDEKILSKPFEHTIKFFEYSVKLPDERFNQKCYCLSEYGDFTFYKSGNDIFVLRNTEKVQALCAYSIGENNYLVFDKENVFYGFIMKDIREFEWQEIKTANIL